MNKFIKFIPYFLIIALALLMHHLCSTVSHSFFNHSSLTKDDLTLIKLAAGILGLVPTIILLIMSRRLSVKSIIHTVYGFAITATVVGFFFLLPSSEHLNLPLTIIEPFSLGILDPRTVHLISTEWISIVYYSLISVWASGMMLLVYGYANDRFSFKEAVSLYPLFAVVAVLVNIYIAPSFTNQINQISHSIPSLTSKWYLTFGVIITLINVFSYLCYQQLFRTESEGTTEEGKESLGWKYATTLGIVAGISGLIIVFTRTIWKYNTEVQFPQPSQYAHHLGTFNSYEGIASLMTLSILLFMSYCLSERLARGWRNMYLAITATTLVLGATFYCFNVLEDPIETYLTVKQSASPLRGLTMISAGYQILISSVTYPLVLSLKEIAIVPIRRNIRFTAKLVIDLLFVKGFLVLGTVTLQALMVMTGSIRASIPYLALIFLIICLSRFFIIASLGKSLEKATLLEVK
jgi:ATP/ADP translocase